MSKRFRASLFAVGDLVESVYYVNEESEFDIGIITQCGNDLVRVLWAKRNREEPEFFTDVKLLCRECD